MKSCSYDRGADGHGLLSVRSLICNGHFCHESLPESLGDFLLLFVQRLIPKQIKRIPLVVSLSIENASVDVSGMGNSPSFEDFGELCISVVQAGDRIRRDFLG